MGVKQFNLGHFRHKQFLSSGKLIANMKFNKCFKEMVSSAYDSYVNFTFELFEELTDSSTEDKPTFFKICDIITPTVYENSREFIIEYINNESFGGVVTEKIAYELIEGVFDEYYGSVISYYRGLSNEYLVNALKKGFAQLSEEECSMELAFFDRNFHKSLPLRLNACLKTFSESSFYLNDMFLEECGFNIVFLIKDKVIRCILGILKEVCEVEVCVSYDDIETFKKCLDSFESLEINELELDVNDIESDKLDYIDDYKKLNKLAKDNGFEYIRCRGDHGIFKNNNGTVVIPQGRSIGKGLSFKIQKAILCLSKDNVFTV